MTGFVISGLTMSGKSIAYPPDYGRRLLNQIEQRTYSGESAYGVAFTVLGTNGVTEFNSAAFYHLEKSGFGNVRLWL